MGFLLFVAQKSTNARSFFDIVKSALASSVTVPTLIKSINKNGPNLVESVSHLGALSVENLSPIYS